MVNGQLWDTLQSQIVKTLESVSENGGAIDVKDQVRAIWLASQSFSEGQKIEVNEDSENDTVFMLNVYHKTLDALLDGLKSGDPDKYRENLLYKTVLKHAVESEDKMRSSMALMLKKLMYPLVVSKNTDGDKSDGGPDLPKIRRVQNEHTFKIVASALRIGLFVAAVERDGEDNPQQRTQENVLGWLLELTKRIKPAASLQRQISLDPPGLQPGSVQRLARDIVKKARLRRIVFMTPELGKFSTIGGLGVMVEELTQRLSLLGLDIIVVSPFYDRNKKGEYDYLKKDGITYTRNIHTWVGNERITLGVHAGYYNRTKLYFLHNPTFFPQPYPDSQSSTYSMQMIVLMAKASLELLCVERIIPDMVVTNDWFTGMVPAYARRGPFGDVFNETQFFHILHNFEEDYQGRLYPEPSEGTLNHIHHLHENLVCDPYWKKTIVSPSRAALLCADQWGTVSPTYRANLMEEGKPVAPLLRRFHRPFAHVNGINEANREAKLKSLPFKDHYEAKAYLQRKYFGMHEPQMDIPLFCFVGRITEQKGVHLILNIVPHLVHHHQGRVQFLVGGMGDNSKYSRAATEQSWHLRGQYEHCFWAKPDEFFTDGPVANLGADFGLMPSLFEPGGIVQQEFFVAGTPVIAYRTGGLKDTVHEYMVHTQKGNGFTMEAHTEGDLIYAIERSLNIFRQKDQYDQLRSNARASVMDLSTVAMEWYREFQRCGKYLREPLHDGVPVMFKWTGVAHEADIALAEHDLKQKMSINGGTATATKSMAETKINIVPKPGLKVEIMGSWDNWTEKFELDNYDGGDVSGSPVRLSPGRYEYKYIVDGNYLCNAAEPFVENEKEDGTVDRNNYLVLPEFPI
eukprot:Clim_evm12s154 gene=Clim_evmTU12s154